ncbi:MAG TPA: class I SAM-dependent methyltransferase [Candidatus Paceibacterota bacterium]|nr:class I SAM-dependent methyltransferase [Candidatus Paceibacterota bacterium]
MFKSILTALFRRADIIPDGGRPWDPQIYDDRFYRGVALRGAVGLGDAFIEGWWGCTDIEGFLLRIVQSRAYRHFPRFDRLWRKLRFGVLDVQTLERSKKVARVHYDESPEFYRMMLGPSFFYTCARFDGVSTLEEAQRQKADLLCRKAELKPGWTVVDIGSGWGPFLGQASEKYHANGVGLTISPEQCAYANEHYGHVHSPHVEFRLQDYRQYSGKADAVVSICMIEHVGPKHYREYFRKAAEWLKESSGIFALQCIVARDPGWAMNTWLEKHIFPNSQLPLVEQLEEAVDGLFYILDKEFFGADYVRTLAAWRQNLMDNRLEIMRKYGERFYRMFVYYLSTCMAGFMSGKVDVGQFVFSPNPRPNYERIRL